MSLWRQTDSVRTGRLVFSQLQVKSRNPREFESVLPKLPTKLLWSGPGGTRRGSVPPANCWEVPIPMKRVYWLNPCLDPQAPRNPEPLQRERGRAPVKVTRRRGGI